MKTCVLITGTNAVGKSSVAWSIINRYGGVVKVENDVTYLAEGDICFAGRYDGMKYGGVDRIVNEKGSSCTSRLPEVVSEGLRHKEVIVCEGMYKPLQCQNRELKCSFRHCQVPLLRFSNPASTIRRPCHPT